MQLVQRRCTSLFLQTHAFSGFYVSYMLQRVPSSVLSKQWMGEVHLFVITVIKCSKVSQGAAVSIYSQCITKRWKECGEISAYKGQASNSKLNTSDPSSTAVFRTDMILRWISLCWLRNTVSAGLLTLSCWNLQLNFCFDLTFPECQKPGNAIGQYPGVSTELEQVIWENVGKSEAEPVRNESDDVIKICIWDFVYSRTDYLSKPNLSLII